MAEFDACDHAVASHNHGGTKNQDVGTTEVPSPLELAHRAAQYQAELNAELRPQSLLAAILVAQLGRHAAGMDLGAASEAATIRFASENPEAANLFRGAEPAEKPYLAAMGSELVAAASRFQARHERGFFTALKELREVSRTPRQPLDAHVFLDEESCLAYLANW